MDFKQLRDADVASLEKLVEPWSKATGKLETGSDTATNHVGNRIRSGAWTGQAAQTATTRVGFLEAQTEAGQTEGEAIHGILKQAVTAFNGSKKRLNDIIADVKDYDKLNLDDSGHVSVDKPDWKDMLGGGGLFGTHYIQLRVIASRFNDDIKDTLADARQLDGLVATALRAAANLDEPKNLDFNPNAKTDGTITLPDNGKVDWPDTFLSGAGDWYLKLGSIMSAEPFIDGTPAEQSAAIGDFVKTEVERAGGECKIVNGMMACVGAPDYMYERGGTTFGDTFVSRHKTWSDLENDPNQNLNDLMNHEKHHRDEQWRKHGVSFGRKYIEEEFHAWRLDYTNRYEADAEQHGGHTGYPVKPPPTPNPRPGPAPTPPN
ncbi:hypothetical protein [Stackebrandtia nassauensis]|uniref:Uncharacterized protein n=1 Tax=Stackebrandtia nassauensis (strain DSM 44728 / CIP 108903 / NRRL B-16338 / NBRC 102104 / LLR-40K-21) TaxID=446470 RepID=D3QAG4_STANL|nr:hypothetical protein [Stackebrandtia nassauensis]ADD42747.1 hypothetical protein Snas_3076 [Stackebrandtia nassauensis DSM 44728]